MKSHQAFNIIEKYIGMYLLFRFDIVVDIFYSGSLFLAVCLFVCLFVTYRFHRSPVVYLCTSVSVFMRFAYTYDAWFLTF